MDGKAFIEAFIETKRLVHLVIARGMAELDVGLAQASLLRELGNHGPAPQGTIARAKQIDPSAAARMFAAMVTRGWIRRRPGAVDRRQKCVELTPRGRRFLARVEAVYAEVAVQLEALLDERDARAVERIRAKITSLAELPAPVAIPTGPSARRGRSKNRSARA
jgi:DNA-binding MarR family transcriptional regulator